MRVLWFTNTPSCYDINNNSYNGGGWISSLESMINNRIELGICFYSKVSDSNSRTGRNGTIYYPVNRPHKTYIYFIKQLLEDENNASLSHERIAIKPLINIVNDFSPEIIHCFGSENIFGILSYYTNIPIVMHIQGILSPSLNAFLPPQTSWNTYLFSSKNIKNILQKFSERFSWKRNSISEQRMMKNIKYVMGRTEWDKHITNVLNPLVQYYYCSEILRDVFYDTSTRRVIPKSPTFVTIISSQLYKGFDLVLKTAKVLKDVLNIDFIWKVYGDVSPTVAYKITKTKSEDVNVKLMGVAQPEDLKSALLNSTAYIHTSYIDNSPNTICEAAISGCAIISTNVGGIPSLIDNGKTGFLVASNDPYNMAYYIKYLIDHPNLNKELGDNAQKEAIIRHNKETIVNRVIEIYNDILSNEKSH